MGGRLLGMLGGLLGVYWPCSGRRLVMRMLGRAREKVHKVVGSTEH